ncbi:unannotated protein [freshwater metagenome]|uniref:Unannotated protein n=1 Tax=freshwater metagenome TaxID=449393 RepID=A0A6J6J524_9ZZZZ
MGSQTHKTEAPDLETASTSGGSFSRIKVAPIREINVKRPGSFFGFSFLIIARASSGVVFGPSLTPIGL